MNQRIRYRIALFFAVLFIAISVAPIVITSIDDSVDISCFYGIGEEEEENESFKLVFEIETENLEVYIAKKSVQFIRYNYKIYSKPHLNLISPPPEYYTS